MGSVRGYMGAVEVTDGIQGLYRECQGIYAGYMGDIRRDIE